MASATDHRHLRLDSLPLVDLRLLSQSDLYSLSLSSSHPHHRRCDDDVLIPKIDRSVFNESAGSRKQTFSRLRLVPRNSQLSSSATGSAVRHQTPEPLDQESFQIIGLLKQLFASESQAELVSVPVDYNDSVPESYGNVIHNIPIDVVDDSAFKKRKRGRPRKNAIPELANKVENGSLKLGESVSIVPISAELHNSASGIVAGNEVFCNSGADIVGGGGSHGGKRKRGRPRKNENRFVAKAKVGKKAVALGNLEDPFGEELRKRTLGLETEAELLGFLGGLKGEWGSWRRKKKIVLASEFGDVLPNGWKIIISLKRKDGQVSLICRRYVSPNGQQFVSCKEVSSFLLSALGLQDAGHLKPGLVDGKIQVANQVGSRDDANANDLVSCSRGPVTSITNDWKQESFLETRNPKDIQIENVLKCHHQTMTFDEKNDLVHHLLSSHKDGNRCNSRICEGVILKDGNYECQFCHKIVDAKICHNSHVVVHVKDDVESIDVSQGLTSMPKNSDTSLSGISPISLQMQESIGTGEEQPSSVTANDEVSCGFLHTKLKADTVIEACIDKDGLVSFSHEEQVIDDSEEKKDQEFCENQARVRHMTNDELGRLDEAIKTSKAATSNNENNNTYECSDGTDVLKCISVSSTEEPKLDIDPQAGILASGGKEKICSSGVEDGNDDSVSGNCGLGNEEECGPVEDANGFLASIMVDSVHENSTELGFCSSFIDKRPHFVSNGDNNISSSNLYESNIIGSSSNRVTSDTDAVMGGDHGRTSGSYLHVPPLNEQGFVAVVNTENSNFKMEEPWQERSFQNNVFIPFGDDNNVNISSIGAVDVRNSKGSEFSHAFDSKDSGTHADTISYMEQEGKSGGDSLLLSSYEHKFASNNGVTCNRKIEEVKEERDFSESDLLSQFDYEQSYDGINNVNNLPSGSMEYSGNKEAKSIWDNEVLHDFGSSYAGMGSNAGTSTVKGSSEGFSRVISGSERTFPITDNVSDFSSSTVEELQLKRGSDSEIGLIYPSGSEQIHAVRDNLKSVSTGSHWQQSKSEDTKSMNNELMTDSGKHAQTRGDVVPELLWRTAEQSSQPSRLADTSSAPMQLSGCYSNSNILSDEGAYGNLNVDEKFESISGLEGLGSSSTEQLQYNFLTAQGTSNSNELKGFSHADMNRGYDSSFWLGREASTLFPDTASRHQTITTCVWCEKEFYHQDVSSGTKLGSVGIMCETCQAKFSG